MTTRLVEKSLTVGGIDFSRGETEFIWELLSDERDKELGRWRWPANPDLMVYRIYDTIGNYTGSVRVTSEATGISHGPFQEAEYSSSGAPAQAAASYFRKYPVKQPWHDAKFGEIWAVTYPELDPTPYTVEPEGDPQQFYDPYADIAIDVTDPKIINAYRIWPDK